MPLEEDSGACGYGKISLQTWSSLNTREDIQYFLPALLESYLGVLYRVHWLAKNRPMPTLRTRFEAIALAFSPAIRE